MDADVAMKEAMAAHKAGRFAEAEDGYQLVLRSRPTDPKPYYYLGLLHFHRGDTSTAIRHMRQCLQYAPNHPHAWNTLGSMLMAEGAESDAKDAYKRVTETAPNMGEGWYNLGICLRNEGDIGGAVASLRTSIEREPNYFRSYEALGALLYRLERHSEAAQLYADWAAREPNNPIAEHMAAATSHGPAPLRATDDYVRKLFDDSAGTFDADLARLAYRAPGLVTSTLARYAGERTLATVLDAGCGTGLCGPLLRPQCQKLEGVDLSPQMLDRARARGCYDELVEAELCAFLGARRNRYDAIVSADTLVYFGDLEPPLKAAREALRAGGVLIVTLEASSAPSPADFKLETHGRYTHSESYVRRSAESAGLHLEALRNEVLRQEQGRDVPGFLGVARKD
jgi:predicted TPR repeat methyltransferase